VAEASSLHHTGLTVADLDRSLAFYRDLLGFEVVLEQEKEGGYLGAIVGRPDAHVRMAHVKLPGSEHRLELFQYLRPAGSEPSEPLEPWRIGPTHVCLIVDDLATLHGRLRAAGVDSFLSPPIEVDTGANAGGRALYLRDPDGVLLELFQPPVRTR
jgi:catechol 2,3-dioxygenase-like lactoylglutathione lyase family enzyme